MENILNYIHLRSDISFNLRPFNEIDALILTELSYVDFTDIVNQDSINLQAACKQYLDMYSREEVRQKYIFCRRLPDLIHSMLRIERYKDIQIQAYCSYFDVEKVIQFAAMTFVLPNGDMFIAFRGTDGTITGWKENMQMTYRSHLPCQVMAKNYLKERMDSIQDTKYFFGLRKKKIFPAVYVGGHSKGGNLAMYASIHNEELHPYISKVFAFDAPGFRKEVWESIVTDRILDKITNYKPKDSIIGCLLDHCEKSIILESQDNGLAQHDAFNWAVDTKDFVRALGLTKQSKDAIDYVNRILMSKSDEDKKSYIDLMFSLTDKLEIRSIADLTEIGLKQGISGMLEISQMTQEERKFLFEVIYFLRLETLNVFKQMKEK